MKIQPLGLGWGQVGIKWVMLIIMKGITIIIAVIVIMRIIMSLCKDRITDNFNFEWIGE